MKKIKSIFPLLAMALLMFTVAACSSDDDIIPETPQPEANFSVEMITDNPQLVSFTNSSEDAEEFIWDFGDESEGSTQKHPTHKYQEPGIYNVNLTALNGDKSAEMSQEITVFGIPMADFSYEGDDENSLTIHFENISQNADSFSWEFGDGSGTSTEQDPTYTYSETGTYTVSLTATGDGGSAQTTIQVEVTDPMPDYDKLYIVGDASESGWNIESPVAFTQSESDPFTFVYEGLLKPGNLKFSTFKGDWCDAQWLNASENGTAVNGASTYIITQGCDGPDNQWVVTEETQGRYKITIDLANKTLEFEELNAPYSELYLVGDASENGWNIGSPEVGFTQSSTDPFIFTYQGTITPGEFKISTYTGDWCDADWLHPTQASASPEDGDIEAHLGCTGPDHKWQITEENQGEYLITVDLKNETIAFEAQ